ncbi:acyl carrier domain protein [Nocardiopsis alba ATCC BAA-2165]|uniref:Acyl carrier protein n=2 Tax=Nocardiopsis alba TaxID=53437 RepID=J7L3B8_NOCAA|nr:acyl carrier domain protein [Nocardiopsis alba ATCC BAA-2165]
MAHGPVPDIELVKQGEQDMATELTEQDILKGLGEIIEEIVGTEASEVTPEKNFVDDLDIDSLSMVEIAVAAQDKFDVEIPDDQLKDLKTVQDVVTFIQK